MPMAGIGSIVTVVKRAFVSGVLVVVPLILTYIVLRFLFDTVDGFLKPILLGAFGYYVPGLGIVTTLLIIVLAGVLTRNLVGARLYRTGDRLLVRLPIIRTVYSAAKQVLEALTIPGSRSFKEVALVEYPRRGSLALGFVTNRMDLAVQGQVRQFAAIFIPSTPTPVSGVVIMVPTEEVIPARMTVEEGVKFVVSGGVVSPAIIAGEQTLKKTRE